MPLTIPLPFPAILTNHVSSSGRIVQAWDQSTQQQQAMQQQQQQQGRGPLANGGVPNGTHSSEGAAAMANGHHVGGAAGAAGSTASIAGSPAGVRGNTRAGQAAATGRGSSQQGRARERVGGVATCPVLSRLSASKGFQEVLVSAAGQLRRVGGSMVGRVSLEGWGYGQGDVVDLEERLQQAAGRYSEEDSDDLDD